MTPFYCIYLIKRYWRGKQQWVKLYQSKKAFERQWTYHTTWEANHGVGNARYEAFELLVTSGMEQPVRVYDSP